MRLIDADEIIKETYGVVIEDMFHMHETVEVVSTIDIENAPTVQAIPIEWLMKKADEWATKDITYDGKPFTAQQVGLAIASMVIDWEKENDKGSE